MVWHNTQLTQLLNIAYPIIQAPMAGGASTAALVAAVSNAGGLGSLGAGYMSACEIKHAVNDIRARTDKAFAVNLFIPEASCASEDDMGIACQAINDCIEPVLDFSVSAVEPPYAQDFTEQIEVLLELDAPVFSFSFGLLDTALVKKFKEKNTLLIGTATSLAEAQALQQLGVHAIVAQGCEAGGHRGTFLGCAEDSLLPLTDLIHQLKQVITLPIIASGGIMTGQSIVDNIKAGASAVQLGTAFLVCDESGVSAAYKNKLCDQSSDNTILTRAFSGKLARGINNHFAQCMRNKTDTTLAYPIQNKLTRPMRNHAKKSNNTDYMSLWAGQYTHLARQLTVDALFKVLVKEAAQADVKHV